jgi:hypothetical protein
VSDTFRGNPPDTRWVAVGVGMSPRFRCARCDLGKSTAGRRKQRVKGVSQWVCAGCVLPTVARAAA